MSALRRNFVSNVEMELRAVEHTLTYLEAALKGFYICFFHESVNVAVNFSLPQFASILLLQRSLSPDVHRALRACPR